MAEPNFDYITWVDVESGGLTPDEAELLEIAVVITDSQLNEVAHFEAVLKPRDGVDQLRGMNSYVHGMHERSGLLADLQDPSVEKLSIEIAEQAIITMLEAAGAVGTVVGGNSLNLDRQFMDAYMPHLNRDYLHYRNVDVSTIKNVQEFWYPELPKADDFKGLAHRALGDIRESIEELRIYRSTIFR